MRRRYFLAALFFLTLTATAQNRQVYLDGTAQPLGIADSKVDSAGNIICVGTRRQPGNNNPYSNYYPLITKTDKLGRVLWSQSLGAASPGMGSVRLKIAANGDYLVLMSDGWPALVRVSPNGVLKGSSHVTFSNTANPVATGLTELPNGNIAICGYNDFTISLSSSIRYCGYILILDSLGSIQTGLFPLRAYGYSHSLNVDDEVLFNDIAVVGNKIVVAGGYRTWAGTRALILTTDLLGNNASTWVAPNTYIVNGTTSTSSSLSSLAVVRGKLFASGLLSYARHTIAQVDTNTFGLSCHFLETPAGYAWSSPAVFIKDTAAFYFSAGLQSLQAGPVPNHATCITKMTGGAVTSTRRFYQDSIATLGAINVRGDTVVLTGNSRRIDYRGYLVTYNDALPTAQICGATDTAFTAGTATLQLAAYSGLPVNSISPSAFSSGALTAECVHEMHICGSAPCPPPGLSAIATALTPLRVCAGDTVRLAETSSCYHKTWYRNNSTIAGTGGALAATQSGSYTVVADNGLCYDTSLALIVQVDTPATPVITLANAASGALFSTSALTYQWLDGQGTLIAGATGQTYVAPATGTYYVQITDSNGCTARSAAFLYQPDVSVPLSIAPASQRFLYPNPAHSAFTLSNPGDGPARVIITDVCGRVVAAFVQAERQRQYFTAAQGLAAGSYFVKLQVGKGVWVQRLTLY